MIKLTPKQEALFPPTVPWLRAEDLVRKKYTSADEKCHCLIGWVWESFNGDDESQNLVVDAMRKRAEKRGMHGVGRFPGGKTHIPRVNDHLHNTKDDVAKLWNDTMRLDFGYQYLSDR